jgi:hypothetical protein
MWQTQLHQLNKRDAFWNGPRLGLALLSLSFVVGCLFIFQGTFADEGDKLAGGLLISRGYVLYRDIFSHHFPFAYYWAALVFRILGPSMLAARLSVLWFQMLSFALIMRLTRWYIPTGLAALAWSILRHLYFGYMVLYNTFSGLALVVVFALTMALTARFIRAGWKELMVIGLFSTIAILSDPVALFAVGFAIAALLISKDGLHKAGIVFGIVGLGLALYLGYLLASRTITDFYHDTIWFNVEIYSKYYDASPRRALELIKIILKGLYILEPRTWMGPSSMPLLLSKLQEGRWLYLGLGLGYRLAILLSCLILLMRRKFLAAGFVYCFTAALLVRSETFFRLIPFVIVSGLIGVWLATQVWGKIDRLSRPVSYPQLRRKNPSGLSQIFRRLAIGVASLMAIGLVVVGLKLLSLGQNPFAYEPNFGQYEQKAKAIRAVACGRDVLLGYYPGDPPIYFFTKMRPISKYLFLWPWVAEVGLPDVIETLSKAEAIVYFDLSGEVWGRRNVEFLADLKEYLDTNYVAVGENYYLSPELARTCNTLSSFHANFGH